jgi:hypothetical protein
MDVSIHWADSFAAAKKGMAMIALMVGRMQSLRGNSE